MDRAARRPDGRVRALASRFADGKPLETSATTARGRITTRTTSFRTSTGASCARNRVFAAWLNHDDSRGPNSLDMVDGPRSRRWVKHYMFDFGSIMGSGTAFAQKPRPGNEYILEWKPSFLDAGDARALLRPWITIKYPHMPPSVGNFEAARFDPVAVEAGIPEPGVRQSAARRRLLGARASCPAFPTRRSAP